LGVESSLEEVSRLSGYREKEGTTLLGLYQAARKKGLYAAGVKMGLEEIADLKTPVIVHFWDNHFLMVEGDGTDTLIITDPPNPPQSISREQFQPFYSGFALLVSKRKISLPDTETKKPDIRFEGYTHDFGKVDPGRKIEHIFTFKNAGEKTLTISRVRTTCGCTAALVSEKSIPPNGRGEIRVNFDTSGRSGFQIQKIYVQTNDPVTPLVQLQIQGLLKADLAVSPGNISFGEVKKGTAADREIYVVDRTGENIQITRVESSSPLLSATAAPITNKPYQGTKILVSLSPAAPLGSLEGKVTIYTTDKKHPRVEIPVAAKVVGEIEVYPSMFFFGLVKQGETPTAGITISTTGTASLKIKSIEPPRSFISTELIPVSEGREYRLTAGLGKDAPKGTLKEKITIYTDNPDQPKIEVPVYGLVE